MRNNTQKLMNVGLLPPQSLEAEEVVLGALLLENCIYDVLPILKKESFYKEANGRIFGAIVSLFNISNPVDTITVMNQLKKTGELDLVGGAYYLSQLTNRVASSDNVEFHSRIIQKKYQQREVIRISTLAIKQAYSEECEVLDLLESTEKEFYKISSDGLKTDLESTSKLVNKAITEIEIAGKSIDGVSGVPCGIHAIDKLTGGWQNSELIIIAARPAMGKTAFVLSIAANSAFQFNKKVAIFSLEMSKMQLIKRLISSETEINSYLLKSGKLDDYQWKQINERCNRLMTDNLFIDDTPGISVLELKAKARRFKEKMGCDLIIVDYLQLMVGEKNAKGNREQEISYISRSLKGLSKDLDIPVIALSQLSRAVETRGGDKRPQLSDLRESGAIEQDADMVCFIHRPEYYGITEDANGQSVIGYGELIIAKHRNGATDSADMRYISGYTKFIDWSIVDYENGLNPNQNFESETNETVYL